MFHRYNLFAYGTLQIPEVMAAVAGTGFASERASIKDHARYRLSELSYPGLRREAGAEAHGILYRELDAGAMARLDVFEDDFYRRETHTVITDTGEAVEAEVYVVPPEHDSLLIPEPWDLERFRTQDLPRFLGRCRSP